MNTARAIANSDVVFLAWRYDQKIPDCLGFRVERKVDGAKKWEPLPAWVGWEGSTNGGWEAQTTEVWPVQKYTWRDFYVNRDTTYVYRITPMIGTPKTLTPDDGNAIFSNSVTVTMTHGQLRVSFNRGIISTQSTTRSVEKSPKGGPSAEVIRSRIRQAADPLRHRLGGDALRTFKEFMGQPGEYYCALYELEDNELVDMLIGLGNRVHIILSNTGADDSRNAAARQTLHDAKLDVTDRMLPDKSQIGHNKFAVHVDENGNTTSVLTGSTNWTYSGLCAQANNVIVLDSTEIADTYLDYWRRLKRDDAKQSATFRTKNRDGNDVVKLDGGDTEVRVWFSPNTEQRRKPTNVKVPPVDMSEVGRIIAGAEQAVLFLLFTPGWPCILNDVAAVKDTKPHLFVHGAISDDETVEMFHRDSEDSDEYAVGVGGVPDQFAYWEQELYRLGIAVIHDKIVVVDPFSDRCTVVAGSHNLGFKASFSNDENMVIVRGNRTVATAYATHIMDIYDHYRWRYRLTQAAKEGNPDKAWNGLRKNAKWQDVYMDENSRARQEMLFWNPNPTSAETSEAPRRRRRSSVITAPGAPRLRV